MLMTADDVLDDLADATSSSIRAERVTRAVTSPDGTTAPASTRWSGLDGPARAR